MTIARMWESRLSAEAAEEFVEYLATTGWPAIAAVPGFVGGEVYRSAEGEHRAVVVTRWADETAAAAGAETERELARFCAREPHAWQFEQVEVGPAEDTPRH
jgi:heme-degrading monooxygenase HmoA